DDVPVESGAEFGGVAVDAADLGAAHVGLEDLRHGHGRGLRLEAVVVDVGDAADVAAPEVVEPAPVVLRLQGEALVLDAAVHAGHAVADLLDGDAGTEEVGGEDDAAVGEPDLAVLDAVGARLALLVLRAAGEVAGQARGHLLVPVEVAERAVEAELAGAG